MSFLGERKEEGRDSVPMASFSCVRIYGRRWAQVPQSVRGSQRTRCASWQCSSGHRAWWQALCEATPPVFIAFDLVSILRRGSVVLNSLKHFIAKNTVYTLYTRECIHWLSGRRPVMLFFKFSMLLAIFCLVILIIIKNSVLQSLATVYTLSISLCKSVTFDSWILTPLLVMHTSNSC